MEFTFVSVMGMLVSSILLMPELMVGIRRIGKPNSCKKSVMIIDFVLKYLCLILMFLPLGVNKFGFPSVLAMFVYLGGNCILLIAYIILAIINIKNMSIKYEKLMLYVTCAIYVISSTCLKYWPLLILGLLYTSIHLKVLEGYANE